MCVYEFLSAGYLGQIDRRFGSRIKSSDVCDHSGRIDQTFVHHVYGFDHVIGISAGVAADMLCCVMYVVEIEHSGERCVCRTCKEVQASVKTKQADALFYNRSYRSIDEYVIISFSAGKIHDTLDAFGVSRIYIMEVDAAFLCMLNCVYPGCSFKPSVIDIGNYQKPRSPVTMKSIVYCSEAHRTDTGKNSAVSAFNYSHPVLVYTGSRMIIRMESADYAAHRLCKRSEIENIVIVRKKSIDFHSTCGNYGIL